MDPVPLLALLLGGYVAATLSGAAGFGGALLLLPIATWAVGAKEAVPLLTLAQLVGNLSRAGLGWREIRWRPAILFCLGAVPAAIAGSFLFVQLPGVWILRGVGGFLIAMVLLRQTRLRGVNVPE
ncbi:MAG: sulfite exporter TauE/SafE family protein, partial [Armatimonadota bacterium]